MFQTNSAKTVHCVAKLPEAWEPCSVAFAFADFEGESFVQVTSFDLPVNEYCPWKLQSAVHHRSPTDFAAGVSEVHPFQPFLLVLAKVKHSDDADCSAKVAGFDGIVAPDPEFAVVAFAAEFEGDTSDNCPESGSCFACSDSPEYCLHIHSHEQYWALMEPSFDAAAAVD